MKYSLGIFKFHEKIFSLSHFIFFSYISLHWSVRKTFFSLLVIFWNSLFKWVHLFFSPLPLASLLFSTIYKPFSDNHFSFFAFLFLGDGLDQCLLQNVRNFLHSSSGTSIRSNPWIYLSFPLWHWTRVSCIAGGLFTNWAIREAPCTLFLTEKVRKYNGTRTASSVNGAGKTGQQHIREWK